MKTSLSKIKKKKRILRLSNPKKKIKFYKNLFFSIPEKLNMNPIYRFKEIRIEQLNSRISVFLSFSIHKKKERKGKKKKRKEKKKNRLSVIANLVNRLKETTEQARLSFTSKPTPPSQLEFFYSRFVPTATR